MQVTVSLLFFVGLALAVGGMASHALVWGRLPAPVTGPPVRLGLGVAIAATAVEFLLIAGERAGGGLAAGLSVSELRDAANTRPGVLTVLVLAALLAAGALAAVARLRELALAPLAVAVLATSLRGHAGTSGHAWIVAADALHLAGAALWTGALAHLVLVIRAAPSAQRRATLAAGVRGYAGLALPTVLIILLTGGVDALGQFRSPGELFSTNYGRTLTIKAAIVGVALLLALSSRLTALRPNPSVHFDRLRRNTAAEIAALAVVLELVAILVNTGPPRSLARVATPSLGPPPLTGPTLRLATLTGLATVVGVAATPDELRFRTLFVADPAPRGTRLTVRASTARGTMQLRPRSCGPGCFQVPYRLRPGATRLAVTVAIPGRPAAAARFVIAWPPQPTQPRLLARVARAMRAVPRLVLDERVTSGLGAAGRPATYRDTGKRFMASEPYGAVAVDVRPLDARTPYRRFAFALPGSDIWVRMTIDSRYRLRHETIVSPGHLIERKFAYGTRAGTRPKAQPSQPPVAAALAPPNDGELAVAEEAGPWIAAAWVGPAAGAVSGTIRLLDFNARPAPAQIRITGARVTPCGAGCVTFNARGRPAALRVDARQGRRTHTAVIPIRWRPRSGAIARRVLHAAVATVNRLRSFRIAERLAGGFGGSPAISRYTIRGRRDYAIVARNGGPSQTVVIGRRLWLRQADGSVQVQKLSAPEDTRELMPWWTHRTAVRLLAVTGAGRPRVADVALADIPQPGAAGSPFWFRLRIDLRSMHVLSMRMIAPAHFMDQRYFAFNAPTRITPPVRGR